MLKKFLHGLLFGAGFSIALVIILSVYLKITIPKLISESTPTPKLRLGKPAEVVPSESSSDKAYQLHSRPYTRMQIPDGGGILSISVLESSRGSKRPSTFQVWLTENKIYKVLTNEETPVVEEVPYPKSDPLDYLDQLVRDNAGFLSGNSKMTVGTIEIQTLKKGQESSRAEHLNGNLRITTDGVVFFIPNKYET